MKELFVPLGAIAIVAILIFCFIFAVVSGVKSRQAELSKSNTFSKELACDIHGFYNIKKYEVDGKIVYVWVGSQCATQLNISENGDGN